MPCPLQKLEMTGTNRGLMNNLPLKEPGSPVNQGTVEFVDPSNSRVMIRCDDGTYACLELASWTRVSNGTRLFWSYTIAVSGVVFSEGGFRVEYEYAEWSMSKEAAFAWCTGP